MLTNRNKNTNVVCESRVILQGDQICVALATVGVAATFSTFCVGVTMVVSLFVRCFFLLILRDLFSFVLELLRLIP